MSLAQKHSDSAHMEPVQASTSPRFRHPGQLSQTEHEAMDGVLPDRPTEAILQWIAGEGPDPWDASSG